MLTGRTCCRRRRARLISTGPREQVNDPRGGCQGVGLDLKRARDLAVRAGEQSREVEPASPQLVEIVLKIEITIEDRPVVLARCDQKRGPVAKEEISRVRRDGAQSAGPRPPAPAGMSRASANSAVCRKRPFGSLSSSSAFPPRAGIGGTCDRKATAHRPSTKIATR